MTPEELAASRRYAKTLLEESKHRFLSIPEVHAVDLASEVDRLRAELATAKLRAWDRGAAFAFGYTHSYPGQWLDVKAHNPHRKDPS